MLETVSWLTCDVCEKRVLEGDSFGWYRLDAKTFLINSQHRKDALWSQMVDRERHYCSGVCLRKEVKVMTELPY